MNRVQLPAFFHISMVPRPSLIKLSARASEVSSPTVCEYTVGWRSMRGSERPEF
jgi:hypothetical protein